MDVTTIALDVAKTVIEVAMADGKGRVVANKRLARAKCACLLRSHPATHVVLEACGMAHYWGRLAREQGHRVTLLPAQYVRPYVRRHKTDRTDAEALLEAARCGQLPTVAVKTAAQQALLAVHRTRDQWIRARTARINAIRGFLREHGVLLPAGARAALHALPQYLEDADQPLPAALRQVLHLLWEEVRDLEDRIDTLTTQLELLAKTEPVVARLMGIPGIGLLTATALVATVPHIHAFAQGRRFASGLGLTPREWSSGGRRRLGGITKQGDGYLRRLVVHGARAVLSAAVRKARAGRALPRLQAWAVALQARRGHNKATIALANKLARIVWVVWSRDVEFNPTGRVLRPAA